MSSIDEYRNGHSTVPSFADLRLQKFEYRDIPIDMVLELYNEPCVGIHQFGIAGQSYYSRKNPLTIDSINNVPKEPVLRKTVAEKLASLNERIKNDTHLADIFGGRVELYIEEGTRLPEIQKRLYEVEFPNLIKQQNPEISGEDFLKKLADLIAKPSADKRHPSPHATGSAFDVCLRFADSSNLGYAINQKEVTLRRLDADTSEANYPDYFEDPDNIKSENDFQIA